MKQIINNIAKTPFSCSSTLSRVEMQKGYDLAIERIRIAYGIAEQEKKVGEVCDAKEQLLSRDKPTKIMTGEELHKLGAELTDYLEGLGTFQNNRPGVASKQYKQYKQSFVYRQPQPLQGLGGK